MCGRLVMNQAGESSTHTHTKVLVAEWNGLRTTGLRLALHSALHSAVDQGVNSGNNAPHLHHHRLRRRRCFTGCDKLNGRNLEYLHRCRFHSAASVAGIKPRAVNIAHIGQAHTRTSKHRRDRRMNTHVSQATDGSRDITNLRSKITNHKSRRRINSTISVDIVSKMMV